jgi:hypothetical protein
LCCPQCPGITPAATACQLGPSRGRREQAERAGLPAAPLRQCAPSPDRQGRQPAHAITGSRWGVEGAEAILRLRAVIDNGDFETYWAFHMHREHYRVHQARYQDRYDLLA